MNLINDVLISRVSQQLASSTSRGQSGKPSQIMLDLMHTLLPGHSHRARSEQPDTEKNKLGVCSVPAAITGSGQSGAGLTTVVFVAVVVAVYVPVTAFGCQDAAT